VKKQNKRLLSQSDGGLLPGQCGHTYKLHPVFLILDILKRILLFSLVAFKMPIKDYVFLLISYIYCRSVGNFTSVLKDNNLLTSLKTVKTKVFLSFARFCGIFRVVQIIDQEHCTAKGNKTLGETKKMTRLVTITYWRFHVGGVVLLQGGQLSPLHGGSGAPLRHNLVSKLQKINTAGERHRWPVMRIRDVYSGSWFLSIPDPGSNNRTKRRGKVLSFFVAASIIKL
jgi:hypothetical protein